MSAVPKEKTLDVQVAERKKEAVDKVAPKIVELVSTVGWRTSTGFRFEKDGATFDYNELVNSVSVVLGANDMFLVNLDTKRCSLFRQGSWTRIFDIAYNEKIVGKDIEALRQKHQVKLKDAFGL